MQEFKLGNSGLPLGLDKQNRLVFGKQMQEVVPSIRFFKDLNEVFSAMPENPQMPAYFMYRNVCLETDKKKIHESNLRFDLTVIPSTVVGKEFVKTLGHSHPFVPETSVSFPEVYGVLAGKAHFLLQGQNEVFVIEAKKNDKVLIAPNLFHVTVNPGQETLVLANWVEKNFESDYSLAKEKKGAAFIETIDGWKKNPHYVQTFSLKFLKPKEVPEFGLLKTKPLYALAKQLQVLDFLKKPQEYENVFEKYFD